MSSIRGTTESYLVILYVLLEKVKEHKEAWNKSCLEGGYLNKGYKSLITRVINIGEGVIKKNKSCILNIVATKKIDKELERAMKDVDGYGAFNIIIKKEFEDPRDVEIMKTALKDVIMRRIIDAGRNTCLPTLVRFEMVKLFNALDDYIFFLGRDIMDEFMSMSIKASKISAGVYQKNIEKNRG